MERTWHSGPPPHIGWWNASTIKDPAAWRWWNGEVWSRAAYPHQTAAYAAKEAACASDTRSVEWTDYYPVNARVPRVDPTTKQGQWLAKHEQAHIDAQRQLQMAKHLAALMVELANSTLNPSPELVAAMDWAHKNIYAFKFYIQNATIDRKNREAKLRAEALAAEERAKEAEWERQERAAEAEQAFSLCLLDQGV